MGETTINRCAREKKTPEKEKAESPGKPLPLIELKVRVVPCHTICDHRRCWPLLAAWPWARC